jgi:hypothetical protein
MRSTINWNSMYRVASAVNAGYTVQQLVPTC